MARIMGLDVGKKRMGVALSDELGVIASPLALVNHTSRNKDADEIKALAIKHGVSLIVVGMPVNMDGSIGPQAEFVKKFADVLRERAGVKVVEWDERLSTAAVTRVLIEGGESRAGRKTVVDVMSAIYILQGYLDGQRA
jgi:putative Holliday junction resolvase